MNQTWLTAQEVADLLKIKKTTVYELIRKGEIPSTRVGKQVRVSNQALDQYMSGGTEEPRVQRGAVAAGPQPEAGGSSVISGQDACLDLLVSRLGREGIPLLRSYVGCHDGLIGLYHRRVTMAAAHLWDRETDSYNLPYFTKLLPGTPVGVVRVGGRMQGFYVKKGNPKDIRTWRDLAREDVRMVNRELGCGTRALLDQKLLAEGISPRGVSGYDQEVTSHLATAGAVAQGTADVGCGCEKAVSAIAGVDFVPLQQEWYDLVFRLEDRDTPAVSILLDYLTSSAFREDMEMLGGYDLTGIGTYAELGD